jgi:hypothetical protein
LFFLIICADHVLIILVHNSTEQYFQRVPIYNYRVPIYFLIKWSNFAYLWKFQTQSHFEEHVFVSLALQFNYCTNKSTKSPLVQSQIGKMSQFTVTVKLLKLYDSKTCPKQQIFQSRRNSSVGKDLRLWCKTVRSRQRELFCVCLSFAFYNFNLVYMIWFY